MVRRVHAFALLLLLLTTGSFWTGSPAHAFSCSALAGTPRYNSSNHLITATGTANCDSTATGIEIHMTLQRHILGPFWHNIGQGGGGGVNTSTAQGNAWGPCADGTYTYRNVTEITAHQETSASTDQHVSGHFTKNCSTATYVTELLP